MARPLANYGEGATSNFVFQLKSVRSHALFTLCALPRRMFLALCSDEDLIARGPGNRQPARPRRPGTIASAGISGPSTVGGIRCAGLDGQP